MGLEVAMGWGPQTWGHYLQAVARLEFCFGA